METQWLGTPVKHDVKVVKANNYIENDMDDMKVVIIATMNEVLDAMTEAAVTREP